MFLLSTVPVCTTSQKSRRCTLGACLIFQACGIYHRHYDVIRDPRVTCLGTAKTLRLGREINAQRLLVLDSFVQSLS